MAKPQEGSTSTEEETASVIVVAEVRGRTRKVHMTLSGADHDWAVIAYRHKVPFTVTGMLAFERRAWRLTDVEVDSSFLRHTLARGNNPPDDTEPVY
jgi:galactose-1-phosphate uridylyltransferase